MTMTGNWTRGCQPQERGPAISERGRTGRLGDGPDLVSGDGFLLQQGGGELGEGLPVAAAPWGRAPGCAGAACAASSRARVRSGISFRISASKNATASSGIRYAWDKTNRRAGA